jgi:hypothetical protein
LHFNTLGPAPLRPSVGPRIAITVSDTKVHYKNCTPEDIQLVQRFEPEIRRAFSVKRLAGDACWEPYVVKTEVSEYRFFRLYVALQPEVALGGDYGKAFLEKVPLDEFFGWMVGFPEGKD